MKTQEDSLIAFNPKDLLDDEETKLLYEREKPYWDLQRSLIEARRRARISQKEIAKKMNVKPSVISKFESIDKQNATLQTIINYARAVGLKEIKINI